MKRSLLLIIILLFVAVAILLPACSGVNQDYVRIHIRANSDSDIDQQAKLEVRDSVVAYLVPLLGDCRSAAEAKRIIGSHIKEIEAVADSALNDKQYTSKASLHNEYFPQKDYGELTLKAGNYDALILELGKGEGANWWCVAFPPLCFVSSDSEGTVYKSKIMEIIEKNKEK